MLTNKDSRLDVTYIQGSGTTKLIKTHRLKNMVEVGTNVFEVESIRKKTKWDLSSQIGFFVYNMKNWMLQFYYDFLLEYIQKSDFELCEMDTDSLDLALSTNTLEEAVKINEVTEFYTQYANWFPRVVC